MLAIDAPRRNWPAAGADHHRVDVGVVPHVQRAGRAGADGDRQKRGEADHRMDVAGREQYARERREHDERHDPRFQELHEI